jgi:putative ABC transport system permease protein
VDRLVALLTWARRVFRRRAADAEMDEELRFHLDMEIEHNLRAGMSPEEARHRALVAFGGLERHRERLREDRRLPLLDTLGPDVRLALRYFRRELGSSLVAVIVLGLGIGLPTAMYSFVDTMLHPWLRVPNGDRLAEPVRRTSFGFERLPMPVDRYAAWAARQRTFAHLAAHADIPVNLRVGDHPVRYRGRAYTVNAFEVVGARPLLGRGFVEDDGLAGTPLAVVISHRAWQDQFDGDGGVIGERVTVNGEPGHVVGVLAERCTIPCADVLVPMRLDASATPAGSDQPVWVWGRLADGVSLQEARAETLILAAEASGTSPDASPAGIADVRRVGEMQGWAVLMLYSMLAVASMVLLIASANVANLLLARTVARARDLAVRTALGASRSRTIAQLMTEAGLLAGLGAALGIAVAWSGTKMLTRMWTTTAAPSSIYIDLDHRALMFVILMSAVAALASGVLPALRASSANVHDALKDGAGGSASLRMGRLNRGLVIAEVAMSVALLVASGLMLKGVFAAQRVELPFPTREMFTAEIVAFDGRPSDAATRRLFWDDVERRLTGIEGVSALGLASSLPGVGSSLTLFTIEGATYPTDRDVPVARRAVVSPGFFATFGVAATQGRIFDRLDNGDALPVVVVNQSFARLRLADGEVIGRRIRVGGPDSEQPWRTIVGVVPDLFMAGVMDVEPEDQPALYTPLGQDDVSGLTVAALVGGSPLRIRGPVRNAVTSADSETAVDRVMTLQERIRSRNSRGPFGKMFLAFGLAALFMSSVGLYGMMSFSVGRRTTEMGIRMALGSSPAQVRGLVLREGMKQLAIGLGVGCVLALGIVRLPEFDQLIRDLFFDLQTYVVVLAVLTVVGLLATAIPAIRATRVDPAATLRSA